MSENKKSSISKGSSCYLLNLKQPGQTARRLKLSFQRTTATVNIIKSGRVVEASVGFLDVSEGGAGVFTPELLHKGALVELCITEPSILKVRGIVAWSIPVTSGIYGGKFRCRSGIQFVFEGEHQAKALAEFVKKASVDPIENIKNAAAAAPVPTQAPGSNADAPAPAAAPVAEAAPAAEATPSPEGAAPAAPATDAAPAAEAQPAAEAAPATETPPASGEGGQQAA